jgi:murein DD-endopeptidase MepM/ murein hydrolase activator NlpD/SH3-like domain-containing protein
VKGWSVGKTKRAGADTVVRFLALSLVVAAGGCREIDEIRDEYRDMTAHEAYEESLADAGLTETALVQDWIDASRTALTDPVPVALPYREEGFLPADEAGAFGFRMELVRGQRLTVDVDVSGDAPARVFLDLYRADPEGVGVPLYVMSADSVTGGLAFTVNRDGPYVVRFQPELLRGGEYQVTIRSGASLAFPVAGADSREIQSFWGADRDGGRRSHQGVDIFMPRGTPVVAGTAGYISRVQVTRLGGKVVWLRDREQNQSLYYAHLDSQIVAQGSYVRPGEVLGLVGNTGNARTTPPHLHFGIYRRGEGAVNPYPFLRESREGIPEVTADRGALDTWVRATVPSARLRSSPSSRADVLDELAVHTPARVEAVTGDYFRVQLPDGQRGFLAARITEEVADPIGEEVPNAAVPVRALPQEDAPVLERTGAGEAVPVLGEFGDFLYVRGATGRAGWMRAEAFAAESDSK